MKFGYYVQISSGNPTAMTRGRHQGGLAPTRASCPSSNMSPVRSPTPPNSCYVTIHLHFYTYKDLFNVNALNYPSLSARRVARLSASIRYLSLERNHVSEKRSQHLALNDPADEPTSRDHVPAEHIFVNGTDHLGSLFGGRAAHSGQVPTVPCLTTLLTLPMAGQTMSVDD
ncbi:hypothetical protein ACJJTC_004787 [Scirpophaga incertulas]